jgi:hypothetical protein
MTQPHAAGALLSNVDDMARWSSALFGGELLSEESLSRMTTGFTLNDGEDTGYGYGLGVSELRDDPIIAHGGGIHGFATYALWMPGARVFVAVLSNSPGNQPGPGFVARQMATHAAGNPFPSRVAIELGEEKLQDYVGVYTIKEDQSRSVTVENGRLHTQRTSGSRLDALPHAVDAFFYERSFTHFTFERDSSGKVVRMLMYHNGAAEPEVATRTGNNEKALNDRPEAEVSPEIYDLWAGIYEIQPGFNLVITRDGDRLISQATGQQAFELHPLSVTRYFLKEVDAEIEFEAGDDGRAKVLTLFQGGQEVQALRVD